MAEWDDELIRRALSRRAFLGGTAASAAAFLVACGGGGTAPTATSGAAPSGGATRSPAAGGSPAAGQAKQGGSIIIGTLGEADSINPFISNESEGNWRVKMLFDQLIRLDPQSFVPKPGLAKEWKRDGLTFTFVLQDDAKFSDGSDLSADDVAFTMKGILAKATGSPKQSYLLSIQGAKEYVEGTAQDVAGIKVVDPKTLVVTLAEPDASFLLNMRYVSPVPKKLLDGKDLSKASKEPFFQNPVGAGPFKFVSWQTQGDFIAERNPYYFQKGKPYLDKFTHRVIADSQALVNALLSGDIDASIYPSPSGYDKLKASQDLAVVVPPFNSPNGWQFNLAHPYLAKKEVRKAVAMSLDMEQFAKDSLYGLGKPGIGPIAPGNYAYDKDLKPIPYDPDQAKSLLQQAGPPPSDVTFIVNKGNVLREDFLTYTQQQLASIGWNIKAETIEYATLVERVLNKQYDVQGVDFTGVTVDPGQLYDQFTTNGSQNYSNYSNPQLDQLLKQAKQELDIEKQKPIYKQIQAILMDDLPTFFAWYRPFLHVVKKKYQGWVDSADEGGIFYELENWYVAE